MDDSGDAKSMVGWGHCGPGCPIEADGWREDDTTFMVEYSDVETWRITAFLIYIYITASLLSVGLILTLIVTLCGIFKQ